MKPTSAQGLVGRESVLGELRALLEIEQVVALVGPPGMGKSAVARALQPPVWVDLEGVEAPAEARARLARALGAPRDNDDALRFALADVEWLVLDAAEGVLDGVEELVATGPTVAWLITSRAGVPIAGSQLELGPLAEADGAELLRRRVRSAHRRDALRSEDLEALSGALDGVPLALELMAPRLLLHSVQELLQRPLGVLDASPLADAIRSRLERLTDPQRRLLRTAAVFPGPFSAGDLTLAAGESADLGLLELLENALVHPVGGSPPRFRVLAPIAAALGTAERTGMLARLAPGVLASTEPLIDVGTADAWAELEGAIPRLTAVLDADDPDQALRAALVLTRLDQRSGAHQATIDRALPLLAAGDGGLRVQLAAHVSDALRILDRPDEALALLEEVEPLCPPETRAELEVARGVAEAVAGDIEGGLRRAREALQGQAEQADPGLWRFVGAMEFDAGQDGWETSFRRALQTADPVRKGKTCASLANALVGSNQPAASVLAVLEQVDPDQLPVLQAPLLDTRAWALASTGALEEAMATFHRAERAAQAVGLPALALSAFLHRQLVALALPEVPRALLDPMPYPVSATKACELELLRAVVHALLGQVDAARAQASQADAALHANSVRIWRDYRAILAAALAPLDPALSDELLAPLPDDRIVRQARTLIEHGTLETSTIDDRVLLGAHTLQLMRLRVFHDGTGFVDLHGNRVDIHRRKVLTKVLEALAKASEPLDVDGICSQVWPGEKMVGNSGTRRVHVAISTLRGLGLRAAIRTVERDGETAWELVGSRVDPI